MPEQQPSIVHRAFAVMATDMNTVLGRDERTALLCWLQGIPHNVIIVLPDDLLLELVIYIAHQHVEMLAELCCALGMPSGSRRPLSEPLPSMRLDSPLEIDFYLEWHHQALHLVWPLTAQHPIKEGQYRIDFAFPPLKVGIELDGYTYHSDRETFTKDRQRQREIEAQGWRIIRFSGDELRKDLMRCVQEAAHFLSVQQYRQGGANPFLDL